MTARGLLTDFPGNMDDDYAHSDDVKIEDANNSVSYQVILHNNLLFTFVE